jgi:hypothetical protein
MHPNVQEQHSKPAMTALPLQRSAQRNRVATARLIHLICSLGATRSCSFFIIQIRLVSIDEISRQLKPHGPSSKNLLRFSVQMQLLPARFEADEAASDYL